MLNIINSVDMSSNSAVADSKSIDINAIDNVNANGGHADMFDNVLHAFLDPINQAGNEMQNTVSEINDVQQKNGGLIETTQLIDLQNKGSHFIVNVTVATKVLNAGVKSINELVHTQ